MATVTVKGQSLTLAPLKSLQVAEFMDELENGEKTNNAFFTRSLRVIAQSLANAGTPQGNSIEDAITALNDGMDFKDLDPAFAALMEITGLRKPKEGEAPAAESTSSASSAAS